MLYLDKISEIWRTSFYNSDESFQTFKKFGYFSVISPDGLKIISINTQSCYILNIALISEMNDSGQQLQWL